MGAVSFAESSFFPVPPDVMLIPMSLARPWSAPGSTPLRLCSPSYLGAGWFARLCIGGVALYDSHPDIGWIEFYGLGGYKVEAFRAVSYAEWGALIIIGKGLTPIPKASW